jgi:hypothetical protein
MKLTEEQFEDVVLGRLDEPDDLDETQRQRLAEARAVHNRLRSAFVPVQAGQALADRIRAQLATETQSSVPQEHPRRRHIVWKLAPLAAAAMIVAGILVMQLVKPPTAQAELASIHEANTQPQGPLHHETNRAKLAAFLKQKLGTTPALPRGDDVNFCGGCTTRFQGKPVVSYMLELDGRRVSIIITKIDPDTLGFGRKYSRNGRTFWGCGHDKCRMAGMLLGDYTYFAVGETNHENLINILIRLLPESNL